MDSTDDTKWQQVGRAKLRTKAQKEEAIKKMPKAQDLGHVKLTAMMYEGDVQHEPLKDTSNTQNQDAKSGTKSSKPPVKKKPKKPATSEPKYNYKSVEAALKQEDLGIEEKLLQCQSTFPDNANMWFKNVAAHLNNTLRCPDDKPTYDGHPFDYPLCNLNKKTYKTITEMFGKDCDDGIVPLIFQHCVTSMLNCIARDVSAFGYKLCIQVLAHNHPTLCCQDLEKNKEKILTMQNVPKQCLSLMWALGQTGFNDHQCGLKVWLDLMLPTLHIKNISQYSMSYIEDVLRRTNGKAVDYFAATLEPDQFMTICRWTYNPQFFTSSKHVLQVQERMAKVYPIFRDVAFCRNHSLRAIFSNIMESMKPENEQLSIHLTNTALECLKMDQHCFKLWRDLYASSLPRTRLLLLYILGDWDNAMQKMPRVSFVETIRAFHNTNADALSRSDRFASLAEFKDVHDMCKVIISRFSEPVVKSTPFLKLLIIASVLALFAFLVGHVTFDIEQHGGVWERSDTYKFLKSKGIITAVSHVSSRVRYFTDAVSSWAGENLPYYRDAFTKVLGPYFQVLGNALSASFQRIVEVASPVKSWLLLHVGYTFDQVFDYTGKVLLQFLEYLDILFGYLYVIAAWCFGRAVAFYQTIFDLYYGETTWDEIRDDLIEMYSFILEKAKNIGQALGNYIAPEQP